MSVHIFGIRHHGPGSARSLIAALEALSPDAILVEGPPDADSVLPLLVHPQMAPPVAILVYAPEQPKLSVYYPFAEYSPEWQALRFGLTRGIPVQFMDLPQTHRLALLDSPSVLEREPSAQEAEPDKTDEPTEADLIRRDPLRALAEAAGYSDGERWWEQVVEQRRGDPTGVFQAILEAMTALRQAASEGTDRGDGAEALREAWMRQTIRAAQKAGRTRIAVVCGAWHGPALADLPPAKADAALLKGLPKIKVEATWIPWTYGRLTYTSGYGAGIESPGWYGHLWQSPPDPRQVTGRWMARVARLLREEDLDASPAQIIDAIRLAEATAALRDRPIPGLAELNEATQAALCFGSETPMRVIWEKLIVGDRLGDVPDETPAVPLQQDLARERRRLRLTEQAIQTRQASKKRGAPDLTLDLREPFQRDQSYLLHRLNILDIEWGKLRPASGKGTFKEEWDLRWKPEFAVDLIEASAWGNTVYDAATSYARGAADSADNLPELTALLGDVLLANLPDAADHLMGCLQEQAAHASDVAHLMDALPPLARVARYSDVRQTDAETVMRVIDGLVARVAINLPSACAGIDDAAASALFERLTGANSAINLLQQADHLRLWQEALRQIANRENAHGLLAGRAVRLMHDARSIPAEETARRISYRLSAAAEPAQAAAWIDGFLRGSGIILLHDDRLFGVIDGWLSTMRGETFAAILPLIRRIFSTFPAGERQMLGTRVKGGPRHTDESWAAFDAEQGALVLPLVRQLLGLEANREQQ